MAEREAALQAREQHLMQYRAHVNACEQAVDMRERYAHLWGEVAT